MAARERFRHNDAVPPIDPNAGAARETRVTELLTLIRLAEDELQALAPERLPGTSEGSRTGVAAKVASRASLPGAESDAPIAWQDALLDALPSHVALLDREGRIVSVNAAWRGFEGISVPPGPGLPPGRNFVTACDLAGIDEHAESHVVASGIRDVLEGRQPRFSAEHRCLVSGDPRWFRLFVAPLYGGLAGAVVMHCDITEQKSVETELRQSEADLRAIVNSEPECVKIVAPDGTLLEMNAAGLRMVEADDPSQVLGLPVDILVVEDDRHAFLALHRRVLEGESGELQFRIHSLKGAERWMETHSTPLWGPDSSVRSILSVTRDVTEARQTVAALVAAQRQTELVLESIGEGVYGTDSNGALSFSNAAAQRMLGWPEPGPIGQPLHELVHHHYPDGSPYPRQNCPVSRTRKDGQTRRISGEHFFRPDGSSFPAEYVCAPIIEDSGDISGAVVSFRDITEELRSKAKLEGSQSLLRIAGQAARVGGWALSLPGLQLSWSEETAAVHDLPTDSTPDFETAVGFSRPQFRDTIRENVAACARDGTPFDMEIILATAADRDLWVRIVGEAERDAEGRITRLHGAIQDITRQKLDERSLAESEERFRLLSRATNDAVWDWDLATDRLWWNEGFETLFGFDRREVEPTGDSWRNRLHPDDRDWVVAAVSDAAQRGEDSWAGEYRFRRGDGSYAYVLDRGHIIRDHAGQPIRTIRGMTDLTDRKQAEERLRDQAALLDKAQDAIFVLNLDHSIAYWNKSAENGYGWTAEEALGSPVSALLYQDAPAYFAAFEQTLERGEWLGELQQSTRNGTHLTSESRWTLVRDAAGQPKSIFCVNTDNTQRKKLEEQLLRAQRMESIGTLAGGIAHDLNNVLSPILMAVELLKLKEQDEFRLEILSSAEASARRGADLVKRVLEFARGVDGARVRVNPMTVALDIEKIVKETFPKDISFALIGPQESWPIHADPTQVHQVLMNLCVNARDAMSASGGSLTVRIENVALKKSSAVLDPGFKPGQYVIIEVEDTGVGMPPEVRERIFEPFFTTKEPGKGTGFGLSTTHTIVRSHSGFVHVESEPGKGSRFQVYLPAQPNHGPGEQVPVEQHVLPHGSGELILVVDDEENIRVLLQKTLERYGYRVMLAAHGTEAVSLYTQHGHEIGVVFTDMAMPVMDGPAMIIALKKMNPDVRIIGSSGHAAGGSVTRVLGAGVHMFIPKPYTAETLLTTIRQVLAPAAPGAT